MAHLLAGAQIEPELIEGMSAWTEARDGNLPNGAGLPGKVGVHGPRASEATAPGPRPSPSRPCRHLVPSV
jgi:hypothetical protein